MKDLIAKVNDLINGLPEDEQGELELSLALDCPYEPPAAEANL